MSQKGENMDSTKIKWVRQVLVNFLASQGFDTGMGPAVLEWAPANNTYVTIDGTIGWEFVGVLENEPKIANNLNMFELEVGQIKELLDTFYRGRKVEIDISVMAPSIQALKLAFGTADVTFLEPTVNIHATVDTTTVTPNAKRLAVVAIGDLQVGQRVAVPCGTTDSGIKDELKHIEDINTTTKVITFVQPLSNLPVNGAVIRVIERERIVVGDTPVEAAQYRLTKFYPDQSFRVYYFKRCKQKEAMMPDGGDGSAPEKYGAKLSALATFDIADNGDLNTEFFVSERIYKTDFS
jgi:hypothetical protein